MAQPCTFFAQGRCRFGSRCRFAHAGVHEGHTRTSRHGKSASRLSSRPIIPVRFSGLCTDFDCSYFDPYFFDELTESSREAGARRRGQAAAGKGELAELLALSARMRSIAYSAARLNTDGCVVLSIGTGSFPEWEHMRPARCIYICVDPRIDTRSIDQHYLIADNRGCADAEELKSVITRVCTSASQSNGEQRVLALKMSIEELLQAPGVRDVLREFRVPAVLSFSHSGISPSGLEAVMETCSYVAMCGMALPSATIKLSRSSRIVVAGTCVTAETVGGLLHVRIAKSMHFTDAPISMESMIDRHGVERCSSMPALDGFSRELASIMFVRTAGWSPDTLVLEPLSQQSSVPALQLAPTSAQPLSASVAELEPRAPELQTLPREVLEHVCSFLAYEPLVALAKAMSHCSIGAAATRAEMLGRDGYRLAKAAAFGEALRQPHLAGSEWLTVQGLQRINAGIGQVATASGVLYSDRANGQIRLEQVRIGNASHQPPHPGDNVRALTAQCLAVAQMHVDAQQAQRYSWRSPDESSLAALAGFVYWRLVWIHPFADGNGRTAHLAALHFASRSARSWGKLLAMQGSVEIDVAHIDQMRLQCKSALAAALREADAAWERASESCQRELLCRLSSAASARQTDEKLQCWPWLRVGEVLIREIWKPLVFTSRFRLVASDWFGSSQLTTCMQYMP